jgi:hypothetical protein
MIPTVGSLHRNRRHLDRKLTNAELVLEAMRTGAALQLQFIQGVPVWTLTTGQQVTDTVARLVTASALIVSVDTGLFRECLGQTWRYVEL